jgi:hypothetical protein
LTASVAYYYFDFADIATQKSEGLIRSLITQLSAKSNGLSPAVSALYSNHSNGEQQPSRSSLISCLKQLLEDTNEAFILVDALDECTDRNKLLDLIEQIHEWDDSLHLLAISRKETDIYDALSPMVSISACIQNEDIKEDIRLYVREEIKTDRALKKRSLEVRKHIEDTLIEQAHGM